MKKSIVMALLIISTAAFAQSTYTSVSYDKTNQPGLMLDLPYKEETIEDFIIDNLKKTGYDAETKGKLFWKQNKLNGFYIFKEVRLEGLSTPVDLYFKVDQRGRKAKEESVIYMLIGRGETFISSTSDEQAYNAAKKFLNGFLDAAAAYQLELDIKEQEESVKDAEKKLERLKDNEKDLNKKIEQLQKDLKENREDQQKQEKKIDDEKDKLEKLKDKRQ